MHENENNDNEMVVLGSLDNQPEDTVAPTSDDTENHSIHNIWESQ